MNCEERRLRSFCSWPGETGTDPTKIAKAGFFFTGQDSIVKCFSCGITISDWTLGERQLAVMTRHRTLSPNCLFVRDPFTSGNIPRSRAQAPAAVQSFASQAARLESFRLWQVPFIKPEDLAAAGFFYSGDSDRVECAFCGGVVHGWVPGDDPMSEHQRLFPRCSYVSRLSSSLRCPLPGLQFRFSSGFQGYEDYDSLKRLGVATHRVPRSPKLSTYESRFNTFHHWPPAIAQTPHQLADAGFFFTGQGDEVRCFHCDGGLRLWERADDPWVEHARWFPDCSFVFLVRGQPFIDSCQPENGSERPSERKESIGQNGVDSVASSQNSTLSSVASSIPRPTPRRLSEQEIQDLMCSPVALSALGAGLELSVVKQALRRKVELTGSGFNCAEALIGAAVGLQVAAAAASEPLPSDDEPWVTPPDSPVLLRRRRPSNAVDALPPRIAPTSPPPISASATAVPLPSNFVPLPTASSPAPTTVSKSIAQLEEEVRRLREWRQCKVCMDREVCVVLLPCGHLVTCAQCAHSLTDCPLCRAAIAATVRTFLS